MARLKVDQEVPQTYQPSVFVRMLRAITQQLNLLSEGFVQAATNAATAAPTTGTYQKGDFIRANNTTKAGTTGSRYIIVGWICTVAGTPGTWEEVHVLTEDITFPTVPAAATQANQETATSTTTYVSPGRQQFHPSAAKAWVSFSGASMTIQRAYNVTSLTDNGVGDTTVNFTTAFSAGDYACATCARCAAASTPIFVIEHHDTVTRSTTAHRLYVATSGGTLTDPSFASIMYMGDQ